MIPKDILDELHKNGIELFHMFDVDCLKDKYRLSKIDNPKIICRFEIPRYSSCDDDEYRSILIQKIHEAIKELDESGRFLNKGVINIKGLDKAKVLKTLYDHSHVQGLGFLQAVPDGTVTLEHCQMLLERQRYFDYLYGRVLKVDLSGDELNVRLYNRDCGEGAAERAIRAII